MEETFKGWNLRVFSKLFSPPPSQILTIPVKAVIAVGSLTCSPNHVFLPPSFPVRELAHSIKCFLAAFYIYLFFSRETAVLNCCMWSCWRDCAIELLWFSLLLFWGGVFSPHVPSMSYPYISSTAHLNGILEYWYDAKPDSLQLHPNIAVVTWLLPIHVH